MARKAVAATLASVVLLTVLVVADATVMTAQDNLAASAQASSTESRELLLERSLAGRLSLDVLAQAQEYLSSTPAGCADLPQYLDSLAASNSTSGDDSGISYQANATARGVPETAATGDNLTVVAPFAGYVAGTLGLREVLSVREVGGGGSVTLSRQETHALNLPIQAGSASSLCASAAGDLAAALSASPCNATLEQDAFDAALPGLVDESSGLGFDLSAGWGYAATCSVAYWFTLVEPGVEGATGSFDWTVLGSGTIA
jgi:hypothetical protein